MLFIGGTAGVTAHVLFPGLPEGLAVHDDVRRPPGGARPRPFLAAPDRRSDDPDRHAADRAGRRRGAHAPTSPSPGRACSCRWPAGGPRLPRLPPSDRSPPRAPTLGAMDLHVIGPLASPAERAAVDAVLGPPESGWVGGARDSRIDGHAARGGHATRARRSQLLPALHAVQSRIGWISQPALNYICRRLAVAPAEAYGVATFYALFATTPRPPVVVHVCDDIACRLAGAERTLRRPDARRGAGRRAGRDGRAAWMRSPCLGLCDRAPAALVTRAGEASSTSVIAPVDAVGVIARPRDRRGAPAADRAAPPRPAGGSSRLLRRVGRRRPDVARRLSGGRRLRGPGPRARDRSRGRHRRGHRLEADGSRRRGLPDRPQVGRRRDPAGAAALPRVQRRRIRARHVQGPRPARGRPVRHRRGDDHRRLRDRRDARATSTSAASTPTPRRASRNAIVRARAAGLLGAGHPRLGLRLRHRAAPRRRRLHLRRGDRAVRIDRGQARRAAQQAAVPGRGRAVRQADRRQQRRDAGQRAAHRPRAAARRSPGSGPRARPGRSCSACPATSPGRASTRSSSARRWATSSSWPVACRAVGPSGRSCSAARPGSSSGPRRSTCRSPSRRRGPPGRRSARA